MNLLTTHTRRKIKESALSLVRSITPSQLEFLFILATSGELGYRDYAQLADIADEDKRRNFLRWTLGSPLVDSRNDPERQSRRLVKLSRRGEQTLASVFAQLAGPSLAMPEPEAPPW